MKKIAFIGPVPPPYGGVGIALLKRDSVYLSNVNNRMNSAQIKT